MAQQHDLLAHTLAAVSALKTGTAQIARGAVVPGQRVALALASLGTGAAAAAAAAAGAPGMAPGPRRMTLAQPGCLTRRTAQLKAQQQK